MCELIGTFSVEATGYEA